MSDTRILGGYNQVVDAKCTTYRTDADSQGIDIYRNGNRIVGYWYAWDNQAQPRYYSFNFDVSDRQFNILTTSKGTFANPSKYEERVVGIGSLDLLQGIFRFNTNEHGRGSYKLRLAANSHDPRSGIYYDPEKKGSGFSMKWYGDDWMSAYWYNYNTSGDQAWWLAVGNPMNKLTIYEHRNARFASKGFEEHEVGTIIDFDGRGLKYVLNSPAVQDASSLRLVKLF